MAPAPPGRWRLSILDQQPAAAILNGRFYRRQGLLALLGPIQLGRISQVLRRAQKPVHHHIARDLPVILHDEPQHFPRAAQAHRRRRRRRLLRPAPLFRAAAGAPQAVKRMAHSKMDRNGTFLTNQPPIGNPLPLCALAPWESPKAMIMQNGRFVSRFAWIFTDSSSFAGIRSH